MNILLGISIVMFAIVTACKNRPEKLPTETMKQSKKSLLFSKDTLMTLSFGSIILPKGWRLAIDDTFSYEIGDATARYRFHNKNDKLIYLEYGLGTIGNPAEPDVVPAVFRKAYIELNIDTADITFTDSPHLKEIRKRSNYFFSHENISTFRAVLFTPKNGVGYSGMYIDSIGQIAENIADFVLYAENLDRFEIEELKLVIRSLTLKNF